MKTVNHYPGGEPIPTRRRVDVDTVIGIIAVALLCAGIWLVCESPEILLVPLFSTR
jgi:hypothetical protein